MAYNTGNPSGSSDPRDLSDSSADIDTWATSATADTHPDRLGTARKTWHGMENEFDAAQVSREDRFDAVQSGEVANRAEDAASNAEIAADRAETARDAAFVNADVYADIASGLAGAADGEQFQVVEGAEIVRYRRDSASTQTEMARYPSAVILGRAQLLRQAEIDRQLGFEWSLAAWYLEDLSRVATTPWYDATDVSTLFQDVDGNTPVSSENDPVRLIKAKNGYRGHDLLILSTAAPGIYKKRGGIGHVKHGTDVSFVTREDQELQVPMFLAAGYVHRSIAAKPIFGITNHPRTFFQLSTARTGQNRGEIITRGYNLSTGTPLNLTTTKFRQAPLYAPGVMHGLVSVGQQDVGINGMAPEVKNAGFNGTESDPACKLGTALNGKTSSFSSDNMDFYGGFAFFGDPGEDFRGRVVNYMRSKVEPPLLATDRNILVVGDSTGDETNETAAVFVTNGEWVYRWAEKFAADNPAAYVEIRGYQSQEEYRPPIVVQDGSGDVIRIWNLSIAGAQPNEALGNNYPLGVRDIPACDTVAINHGYNPQASGNPVATFEAQMLALIEAVKAEHPAAHIFLVRQPRTETSTAMDAWVAAIDNLAALYGADTFDVWQRYQDFSGDKSTLYADGLHPSEAGVDEWIAQINIDYAAALPIREHGPGYIKRETTNLLTNGQFFEWASGLPLSWTKTGGGTVSEVVCDDAETGPVAVEVADSAVTSTYIQTTFNPASIAGMDVRGQTVTLSVRQYIEAAINGAYQGRIYIASDGTGGVTNYVNQSAKWAGGWQWSHSQVAIPFDATQVTVRLYGRFDGGGAFTARYSHAAVALGDKPRISS